MYPPGNEQIAPEKWGLGDNPFLLGVKVNGLFSVAFAVSFREGNKSPLNNDGWVEK